APAEALEQRAEALGRHWAAALTGEHVWRCLLLTLQAPQGANFIALHWMHRGGALFAPTDVQPAGVDLDLVPLQIAHLGRSKPGAVGQRDHGGVPVAIAAVLARGLHELLDLAAGEIAPTFFPQCQLPGASLFSRERRDRRRMQHWIWSGLRRCCDSHCYR